MSADAGYCSDANLRTIKRRRIEGYIATGRQKHGTKSATAKKTTPGSLIARMSTKLKRAGYRSRYRLRKQIVEPVFGQIKQARGFRQFLLRGIEKVSAEWALICTAHNLVKLAASGRMSTHLPYEHIISCQKPQCPPYLDRLLAPLPKEMSGAAGASGLLAASSTSPPAPMTVIGALTVIAL